MAFDGVPEADIGCHAIQWHEWVDERTRFAGGVWRRRSHEGFDTAAVIGQGR
jgi:hypothetical protein